MNSIKSRPSTLVMIIACSFAVNCWAQHGELLAGREGVTTAQGKIIWDEFGIPHIYGPDLLTVIRGYGYAQMENQAELILQKTAEARGRTAEYFGAGVQNSNLQRDVLVRTYGIPDRAAEWYKAGGDFQGAILEAFAAGINEYASIHFMLSRVSTTPATLADLNDAIDHIKSDGEYQRIADTYALPILIHQTLDSDWFRFLVTIGTIAFALSGVVLAYAGRSTLFEAMVLASLPAVGGGVIRDLLLRREPLGIVRDPFVLLTIFGTVIIGMLVIRISSFAGAKRFVDSLQSRGHFGTGLIQICDGLGLAAFLVIGVVVVLDTSVQPLWLWGPISAGITSSFGGIMRDLLRRDAMAPKLTQELYPEIAVVWGLALSLFLQWEAERLQPEEIFLGVVVTIVGAFLTRMLAIAFRLRGWAYV